MYANFESNCIFGADTFFKTEYIMIETLNKQCLFTCSTSNKITNPFFASKTEQQYLRLGTKTVDLYEELKWPRFKLNLGWIKDCCEITFVVTPASRS